MLYGNYVIYYHMTQITPIFLIIYGKFRCHMVTKINHIMKLKYFFIMFFIYILW